MKRRRDREIDPRDVPLYGYSDVARYLGIPVSTIRSWVQGRIYSAGGRRFRAVIERPDASLPLVSFTNLVEIHVLSSIRSTHRISLQKVRRALGFIDSEFPTDHPLARLDFRTDQVDLFVDIWGRILSVSNKQGQVSIRRVVEAYLERIERDVSGLAVRLYPFTRASLDPGAATLQPRVIVIDPRVSFGRPVLVGTGVPTAVLAERFKAGESIGELARDFNCPAESVEEAIRCEHSLVA